MRAVSFADTQKLTDPSVRFLLLSNVVPHAHRYVRHFMPHGVTPRQFDTMYREAEVVRYGKDTTIVRQGQKQEHVHLVVKGKTRASVFGRRLSAASFTSSSSGAKGGAAAGKKPQQKLLIPSDAVPEGEDEEEEESDECRYAASGAWIGEIAFLEQYWTKEQRKASSAGNSNNKAKKTKPADGNDKAAPPEDSASASTEELSDNLAAAAASEAGESSPETPEGASSKKEAADSDSSSLPEPKSGTGRLTTKKRTVEAVKRPPPPSKMRNAIYTIVADGDEDEGEGGGDGCTVLLRWRFDKMEGLMASSSDMRSALTRAMTAAIVGKVIHFTVSRSQQKWPTAALSSWRAWLDDWKNSSAEKIEVEEVGVPAADRRGTAASKLPEEDLPATPELRSFRSEPAR